LWSFIHSPRCTSRRFSSGGSALSFYVPFGQDHGEATKQVIRYLFATKDYGITYSRGAVGIPHLYLHARKTSLAVEDPLQRQLTSLETKIQESQRLVSRYFCMEALLLGCPSYSPLLHCCPQLRRSRDDRRSRSSEADHASEVISPRIRPGAAFPYYSVGG